MTRKQQKTASITHHRLFGPGLALWFGALFGLSSLAVRTSLFEALVVASRLDQVVPAAAPPLGHAARLLLALAFAVIGGMIGWAVARMIAGAPTAKAAAHNPDVPADPDALFDPQPAPAEPVPLADDRYQVRARDAHPDAPARRPILAREELRHAEFAAPIVAPAEMAPAAMAPAEPAHPAVAPPLPAAAPVAVDAAPVALPEPPTAPLGEWGDDGPVLGPARDGAAAAAEPAPILTPVAAQVLAPVAAPADPEPASPVAPALQPRPEPAMPTAAQRIAASAPTDLSHVELIERLALAMQRREVYGMTAPVVTAQEADHTASGAESLRAALASLKGTGHG